MRMRMRRMGVGKVGVGSGKCGRRRRMEKGEGRREKGGTITPPI